MYSNKIQKNNRTQLSFLKLFILSILLTSCVSIPKETVTLSKVIGSDLNILQKSHINMTKLYYQRIKSNINNFIDDTYKPYIINFMLKNQLEEFKKGNASLLTSINDAAQKPDKKTADLALDDMSQFLEATNSQIEKKRNELLNPIEKQENEILKTINDSYSNTIYANATMTGYLESIRKVKDAQNEALSLITGVKNTDSIVRSKILQLSDIVNSAIDKGKGIEKGTDEAKIQIEDFLKKIKELTNKK
tara:strand:+ start:3140 stop:3883 length:744 start_codon:yes stop_codon:yes gene_type:complete